MIPVEVLLLAIVVVGVGIVSFIGAVAALVIGCVVGEALWRHDNEKLQRPGSNG